MKLTTEELTNIARDFRAGAKRAEAALKAFDDRENDGRESFMRNSFERGNRSILMQFHERVAPDFFDTEPEVEPRRDLESRIEGLQASITAYANELDTAHHEAALAHARGVEEATARMAPKVKELEAARDKCNRAMWFNIACGLAMLAITIWRLCA